MNGAFGLGKNGLVIPGRGYPSAGGRLTPSLCLPVSFTYRPVAHAGGRGGPWAYIGLTAPSEDRLMLLTAMHSPASATWVCPFNGMAWLTLVGGGGGAYTGASYGSGGAGETIFRVPVLLVLGTSYSITIGAGGQNHASAPSAGSNSVAFGYTARGGGAGGSTIGGAGGGDGGSALTGSTASALANNGLASLVTATCRVSGGGGSVNTGLGGQSLGTHPVSAVNSSSIGSGSASLMGAVIHPEVAPSRSGAEYADDLPGDVWADSQGAGAGSPQGSSATGYAGHGALFLEVLV